MSVYPTDQRCPRCQYPVVPGAAACANCGLVFQSSSGAYPNTPPAYPSAPGAGGSYGTMPAADPYGSGGAGGYGSSQSATYYNPQGTLNNAPTVNSSLYPQGSGGYPGSQPQGGYGTGPGGYPGSQPPGSFPPPPPPPTYPGAPPDGGFGAPPTFTGSQPQGVFGAPPAVAAPPTPKKGLSGLMIAIIVIVVVVILGGGGTTAYILTRPKPVITFDKTAPGTYAVGQTPAGAIDTYFCISGTKFSGNSTVTFLLDGQPAPDTGTAQTNSDGAITFSGGNNACGSNQDFPLKVTDKWGTGNHTITAKDASNYATQAGITVAIVAQGEAKTPGPNGAPYDSQSFNVRVTITISGGGSYPDETLNIHGRPDPMGGSVCQDDVDNGSQQSVPGSVTFSDGTRLEYTETVTYSCTGTFKGGMLTYTETATNAEFDFQTSSGTVACLANQYKEQDISGTFGADGKFSGTWKADQITLNCPNGTTQLDAQTGTFIGTLGG